MNLKNSCRRCNDCLFVDMFVRFVYKRQKNGGWTCPSQSSRLLVRTPMFRKAYVTCITKDGGKGMERFRSFSGIVTMIHDFPVGAHEADGCYKLMSVEDNQGMIVNFVIAPTTYFVEQVLVRIGDQITGYYDANVPVPLIYPPQYQAVVIAKDRTNRHIKVDYFNEQFESSDGKLRLNITPRTPLYLENGQKFTGSLANRTLIVCYEATTKSIPAQTTPTQIVIMC